VPHPACRRLRLYGPGQHDEVHLPVVIDGHLPDDRLGLVVPRDQHLPGTYAGGINGLAQRGPAESFLIFVVEVGYQVDTRVLCIPPLSRLRVVVDVRHDLMRAVSKLPRAVLQVIVHVMDLDTHRRIGRRS